MSGWPRLLPKQLRRLPTRAARWVLLAGAHTVAHAACPLTAADGALLQQGAVRLAWRSEPAAMVNGQPFSLQIRLCPAAARLARVDATMPEHRHGMNYKPSLKALGDGRWQVEGLLWHMAGRWELRWDVQLEGTTEVLRSSVVLR